MGIIAKGTHDEMLNENGWLDINTAPSHTDIYLKCSYMMDNYVCVGQVDTKLKSRIKSNIDADIFFRSGILGWKPID